MLFIHTCPSCGETTEPRLIIVAAIVNVCCGSCLSHLEYKSVDSIPGMEGIKKAIWELSECNTNLINQAKEAMGFRYKTQLQYYKLYGTLVSQKMGGKKEKENPLAETIA